MTNNRLPWCLFFLRVSVFLVMLIWTIDKFINPAHATGVYQRFYHIGGVEATPMMVIGAVELVIIIGFVLGVKKTLTYGLVLLFHAVSTLSTYEFYLDPYAPNSPAMLFFAAWPMLAACFTLFMLREQDTLFSLG